MDQPTIRLMIREKLTDGMSTPAEQELRQQIHARLSEGHLGSVDGGVSKSHQGTGGPCVVCRRSIEPTEVEREVEGAGVCLHAHEACYKLWREESVACRVGGRERVREGAASSGRLNPFGRFAECVGWYPVLPSLPRYSQTTRSFVVPWVRNDGLPQKGQ